MPTRFAVVGGAGAVRPAARRAADAACHLGVPPGRYADVELAVHEAIANALEHGHAGDPSVPIDVEVARSGDGGVVVRVIDQALGAGGSAHGDDGRGRGRTLLGALAERVAADEQPGRTMLTLWWSAGGARSGVLADGV